MFNPPVKAVVFLGLVPGYALIETIGRRSGRRRRTVVGIHEEDDAVWMIAEQGHHAGYVRNLEADPDVRLRIRDRWQPGTAAILAHDDPRRRLERLGRPVTRQR